jgi:lipoate-protein ligase A
MVGKMSQLQHLRLIIETAPCSGAWNMAVDEVLLETAISANVATLRWYQWEEATVSLGYFQKSADLSNDPVLSRLPVVRRLSGGGAIIHDDELTYSLALPASQRLFMKPPELYEIVHQSLVEGLQELGAAVSFRGQTVKKAEEPLLCFQRQDEHDLVLAGCKILGSAQRRRRGAILQHGSLIQRSSSVAKQISGFADLCMLKIPKDFAQSLGGRLAKTLSESWDIGELSDQEREIAQQLTEQNDSHVQIR